MSLQDRDWYRDAIKEKSKNQNGKVLDHMDLRNIRPVGKPIISDQTYLLTRIKKNADTKEIRRKNNGREMHFLLAGVLGSVIGTALMIGLVWFLRG